METGRQAGRSMLDWLARQEMGGNRFDTEGYEIQSLGWMVGWKGEKGKGETLGWYALSRSLAHSLTGSVDGYHGGLC
jgi:hypothetical protein